MPQLLRSLFRTPLATCAALAALALAIGASTLVFSVVNGVLLRPLQYAGPERLAIVWEHNVIRGNPENSVSPANYLYWRDRNHSFSNFAAVSFTFRENARFEGQAPERLSVQAVTANLFETAGVSPALGRVFTAKEDEGQQRLVVVSSRYWRTRLGGQASALGKNVTLDGDPFTIVGVMPAGFWVLDPDVDAWTPTGFTEQARTPRGRYLRTLARLRPDATFASAQVDLRSISSELTRKFPAFDTGWTSRVVPIHQQVTGTIRPALLLLIGAAGCVLLIACANVANLLLARSTARRRELAVRAALGASRGRLVRQLMLESLTIASGAGLAGYGFAAAGLRVLQHSVATSETVPRLAEVTLDLRVVACAVALTLAAAILAGLVPAIAATRLTLVGALRDGVRGATLAAGARLRPVLVGVEVALAVVLLAGAGLLLRSLSHLLNVNPGFSTEDVLTAAVSLPDAQYATPESRTAFYEEAIRRTRALPGVASVGAISWLPMTGLGAATDFEVVGQPKPALGQSPVADVRVVSGDYFASMGIPLLSGRLFESSDTGERAHVVVINQALADELFPGQDPLGHELVISWNTKVPDRIVGVVGNVRHTNLEAGIRPMTYWPHTRFANSFMTLTVKTRQQGLGASIGTAIRSVDPGLSIGPVRPMTDLVSDTVSTRRLVMSLLATFAGLALVLAALGLYAVLTTVVAERRAELAIRTALGASTGAVVRLVLRQAVATTAIGAVVGLVASRFLARLLEGMLFEIRPSDPWALGGAAAVLLAVAVLSSALPSFTAARVDPMEALRAD